MGVDEVVALERELAAPIGVERVVRVGEALAWALASREGADPSDDVAALAARLRAALAPGDVPEELSRCLDACALPASRPTPRVLAEQLARIADGLGADPLVAADDALASLLADVAHAPHAGGSGNEARVHVAPGSDRFEMRKKLGQGGFGVVYEAFDKTRDAVVAVKTLARVDGEKLYRFKKEFRALSELVHPNLVRLHELFADDGAWFFSMELVHGVDFVSYVRAQPSALRACLRQLVDGVAAIHAAGRLHRDLKPHNVLVTSTGDVKILDFGLVAELSPDDRQTAESAGTPAYMAPETIRSEPPTTATDWYSFGAMLYEALTGSIPFAHASGKNVVVEKLIAEPPAPRTLSPTAPADLDALASALLRRQSNARPTLDAIRAVTHADRSARAPPATATATNATEAGFFGRAAELEHMRRALADSRNAPVVVVVEGESGIGKTALVRRFLSELRHVGGAAVLTGRCYERESVPFNAFDGVVDSLSRYLRALPAIDAASVLPRKRDAAMLARLFPVLERVPAWPTSSGDADAVPVDPHDLRSRAFTALRELFARLAERGAVTIFIDDMQWADADSRVLIDALLQEPQPPSLLLLCTARPGHAPAAGAYGDARRVALGGLAVDDVAAMAAALGVAAARSDAQHVADEARGHPLFVQELLLHGDGARSTLLDNVLWQRVSRLPTRQRALLDLAALAGAPMSATVLADALGASVSSTIDDADALRSARLLRAADVADAFEPYHDRIRELVVAHVDGAARKHLALADAFERAGAATDDPQVLVRHFEAAGENARASVSAERAAELAQSGLAFERAAQLFATALRLGAHTPHDARSLQERLGLALANAGRGADAASAYLASCAGVDDDARIPLLAKAAVQLIGSGHRSRGNEVLREVLLAVGERWPTSRVGALLSFLWQRLRLRGRGLAYVARPRPQLDDHTRLRLDLSSDLFYVVAATDVLQSMVLHTRSLRHALDAGEIRHVAECLCREANYLVIGDPSKLPTSLALLERASLLAPAAPAVLQLYAASIAFSTGRPGAAMQGAARAERIYREETTGQTWLLEFVRRLRLMSHRSAGSLGEIVRCYDGYLADVRRRGDLLAEFSFSSLLSIRWLAVDRVDEARRTLARASELSHVQRESEQRFIALVGAVEVDLYLGDTARTLERLGDHIENARRSLVVRTLYRDRIEYFAMRGRIALAEAARTGDRRRADVALDMARRLKRQPSPAAEVRAGLLSAGVCHQRGATDDAVALLRRVSAHADADGMTGIGAVARRRLGVLIGGDEGRALVAAADAVLRAECVKVPERIVDVYAPGLAPR